MSRIRGTERSIDSAASRLRREATDAERVLWDALRNRKLEGAKFRRQHPVGRFVLDFCCPASRLVIEVDGPVRDDRRERDAERTSRLAGHGYRVLRFTNSQVMGDLPMVLERIRTALKAPTPRIGRGVAQGVGGAGSKPMRDRYGR